MNYSFNSLNSFEYQLLEKFLLLDKKGETENNNVIICNMQISGGMDSMCLLNSIAKISNSKFFIPKCTFIFVAQHFNHKKRGEDSELDAQLVAQNCLKNGIPVYLEDLKTIELNVNSKQGNFQNYARNWRRQKAIELCEKLSKQYQAKKYYILTAHHARDHVETVLMHLLRGCALDGLTGISEFDAQNIYFRPFYNITYNTLIKYCEEEKIEYRLDSSNLSDKYERNYIRHHILPHLKHLNNSYEKAFITMSSHIQKAIKELQQQIEIQNKNWLLESFSDKEIYDYLIEKNKELKRVLTQNAVLNIFHEINLFKKSHFLQKDINLAQGWIVQLNKANNNIDIVVVQKKLSK